MSEPVFWQAKARFLQDATAVDISKRKAWEFASYLVDKFNYSQIMENFEAPPEFQIRWASFHTVSLSSSHSNSSQLPSRLHLYLGLEDGFQIWDLTDASQVHIVKQKRGVHPVHCMAYVPLADKPLMAYAQAQTVIFISLLDENTEGIARIPETGVRRVYANARYVIVVSKTIAVYSTSKLTERVLQYTDCASSPDVPFPGVALGPSWIAYATTQIPTNNGQATERGLIDRAMEMTHNSEDKGYIIVKDLRERNKVIAHFVGHHDVVNNLAFNSLGTSLASSSGQGYHVKIWDLCNLDSQAGIPPLLYKAFRSVAFAAKIVDMCFSPDGKYLAFSTYSGTTHIFAINPFGGPISPATHAKPSPPTLVLSKGKQETVQLSNNGSGYTAIKNQVLNSQTQASRDTTSPNTSSTSAALSSEHVPVAAFFFDSIFPMVQQPEQLDQTTPDVTQTIEAPPSLHKHIFTIYPSGQLVYSSVIPLRKHVAASQKAQATESLELKSEGLAEYFLSLKNYNVTIKKPQLRYLPAQEATPLVDRQLINETHAEESKRLWMIGQITFAPADEPPIQPRYDEPQPLGGRTDTNISVLMNAMQTSMARPEIVQLDTTWENANSPQPTEPQHDDTQILIPLTDSADGVYAPDQFDLLVTNLQSADGDNEAASPVQSDDGFETITED